MGDGRRSGDGAPANAYRSLYRLDAVPGGGTGIYYLAYQAAFVVGGDAGAGIVVLQPAVCAVAERESDCHRGRGFRARQVAAAEIGALHLALLPGVFDRRTQLADSG